MFHLRGHIGRGVSSLTCHGHGVLQDRGRSVNGVGSIGT